MSKPPDTNKRELKPVFLENRRQFLTITKSCKLTGIDRRTYYNWIDEDPEFARADEDAKQQALDSLEENTYERAMTGKDHSSALLSMFILKAYRPIFKDRMLLEHSQPALTAQDDADKVLKIIDDIADRQLPANGVLQIEAPKE
jgi:hypothetical protein